MQPSNHPSLPNLPEQLSGGLVLRRAGREDMDRLAAFNAKIHSDEGPEKPDTRVAAWTRDLLSGEHPTFSPGDFTIVEESATGKIVSSMNLISQEWEYAGIPFKVGRPELVGTLPEYRRRGLIRRQFEVVHAWSQARGELLQAITGIPNYYRQFGYEMGMDLGGGRIAYKPYVPALPEGQSEPYQVRPAAPEDAAFIHEVYEAGRRRSLVSAVWSEALWRYEMTGKSVENVNRYDIAVIETPSGEKVGFVACPTATWGPTQVATRYELTPGTSWWAVTPSVIRFLWKTGEAHAARDQGELSAFGFWLGRSHPVYLATELPRIRQPYAWFVRVPDLPGFLMHIAPALERRLEDSVCSGYTGELKFNFYRGGLKMDFAQGRLRCASAWQESREEPAAAAFPDLTFLQLVFGYRTLAELRYAFADCRVNNEKFVPLIDALFPTQGSDVFGVS